MKEGELPTHFSSSMHQNRSQCLCACLNENDEDDHHPAAAEVTATHPSLPHDPFSLRSTTLRCPVCVQKMLRPYFGRHDQAFEDHALAKEECVTQLQESELYPLADLQAESHHLRDRLAQLRSNCAGMAVQVAAQAVENDERREQHSLPRTAGIPQHLHHLNNLEDSVVDCGMKHALQTGTNRVRMLRIIWARKAFLMHRLDIDIEDTKPTKSKVKSSELQERRRARGIGKIGGLPLPHAGPELYGFLPPRGLQSALRLVASLTTTVARCLGIILPHPILLTPPPSSAGGLGREHLQQDITECSGGYTSSAHPGQIQSMSSSVASSSSSSSSSVQGSNRQQSSNTTPPSSASSLLSYMGGSLLKKSAKTAFAYATGKSMPSSSAGTSSKVNAAISRQSGVDTNGDTSGGGLSQPSMDSHVVAARIDHASAAILAEDVTSNCQKFALSAEKMHQEDFAIALQLLQNDVIVLCIRAGVPVNNLWPAEAVLLNLYALNMHCQDQSLAPF